MTVLAARVNETFEGFRNVFAAFAKAIRPIVEQLGRLAEQIGQPGPPSDPRERALWLRRNRNTGPRRPSTAPLRLDPAGGLRWDPQGRPTYRPALLGVVVHDVVDPRGKSADSESGTVRGRVGR